jgi:hypothetical protein
MAFPPLLPLAGGAAALAAAGAKLKAYLSKRKVDQINERADRVTRRLRKEKTKFSKRRLEARDLYEKQLNLCRAELEELDSSSPQRSPDWEPDPWIKQRLAEFVLRPRLGLSEPQVEEPVAIMRSASMLLQQGLRMEKTNKSLGNGMQILALATAITSYIASQVAYAANADKFVAQTAVHLDACEKALREFESRFAEDIAEDKSSAEAMMEFLNALKVQRLQEEDSITATENLRFAYRGAIELFLGMADRNSDN